MEHVKPRVVLEGALRGRLDEVVVVGRRKDGSLFLASSEPAIDDIVKLLKAGTDRAKEG